MRTPILGSLRNRFQRFFQLVDVDRAVFYGIATRIWSTGAGPLTALLVAVRFSREVQGYYYTFSSIVALQVFAELGLGVVILNFASHEWTHLELDVEGRVIGDPAALSRLRSIVRIAAKWFGAGAVVVALGLSVVGYRFFVSGTDYGVSWPAPWVALSVFVALNISLVPIWSLLEGCNQVRQLYTFRFFQGVLTGSATWLAIFAGAKLWTAVISGVVGFLWAVAFILRKYRGFFGSLWVKSTNGPRVHWRSDMVPMQWRIAVSWISGYIVFSLFTPVLFKYRGAIVAGQMGMTLSLMGLLAFGTAWLSPKIPMFGMLIAQGSFQELDRLFWRVTRIVFVSTIALAGAVFVLVCMLGLYWPLLAARVLPLTPTVLFLGAQILFVSSTPFSAYLRAHKREPLMAISVTTAILVGGSTVLLGKHYGAMGMAVGFLAVNVLVYPVILLKWQRCRVIWHAR